MAVSLDALSSDSAAVPPPAPLAMPDQDLTASPGATFAPSSFRTVCARLLTFGGAGALTAYAGREMVLIVSFAEVSALQWLLVGLFVVTFAWIALAASNALTGLIFCRDARKASPGSVPTARTALLMPLRNEDPARSLAGLQAMAESLAAAGLQETFEIFVISDTDDSSIWIEETAAVHSVRAALAGTLNVWYRRRGRNEGKKAGNIRDFIVRWGARYELAIVLDADSILSVDALVDLVCEMEADPSCALLQTSPRLCGGRTLFARMQQFASATYGPVVARGIAAWQGDDGNYWGHNAVIRTRALAAAAGLPSLAGRQPFGGEIQSHDFVEAALLRRAGWSVRMLPTIEGTWEETPPSLLDSAVRDRRWAQGNLQHLRVLRARGLRWVSRAHMLIGVMSYVASPVWLALIIVGLAITAQVEAVHYQYFTEELSLFPRWPVFDSERMIALLALTFGVLLLPKVLGLLWTILNRKRTDPGVVGLCAGAVVETLLSVLYAPVMMLIQSQQLWEILRGKVSGWNAQQRSHRELSWRIALRRHIWHLTAGVILALVLYYVSVPLLLWMIPTWLALLLAVPMSRMSGSTKVGNELRAFGLLRTPEEASLPPIIRARDELAQKLKTETGSVTLKGLIRNDALRDRHFSIVSLPPSSRRRSLDLKRVTMHMKIADAVSEDEVISWLSNDERLQLLSDDELFRVLCNRSAEPTAGRSVQVERDND